jgi:hypothetical protein
MGMFDSFYDAQGREWQTKALGKSLHRWGIGDPVPLNFDCQIEAIGGRDASGVRVMLATIKGGALTHVGRTRDETLPLIPYGGLGAMLYGDWLAALNSEPTDSGTA